MDDDALTDKQKFVNQWIGTLGEQGVEEAWLEKVKFELGPRPKSPMFFMGQDIHYESPIDGRPVTSLSARRDDLARSGCIEYDPEMKKDAAHRRKEKDEALDNSVDDFVEREFANMPVKKKEVLAAEMQAGVTAEPIRQTQGA